MSENVVRSGIAAFDDERPVVAVESRVLGLKTKGRKIEKKKFMS